MATKDKIVNLEDLKVLSDHVEGEVTDLKSDLNEKVNTYGTDEVTALNADFITKTYSKNRYNSNTATSGYTMDVDGSTTANANRACTDYIYCYGKTVFSTSVGLNGVRCFYGKTRNFLGYQAYADVRQNLAIPSYDEDVYYMRLSIDISRISTFQVEFSSASTAYEEYTEPSYELDDSIIVSMPTKVDKDGTNQVTAENAQFLKKVSGTNKFNKDTATTGYTMNTDGTTLANANRACSDYIYCYGESVFSATSGLTGVWCFYDADKSFISFVAYANVRENLAIPNNAYYMRVSLAASALNTFTVVFASTATVVPYVEYFVLDGVVVDTITEPRAIITKILQDGGQIKLIGDSIMQGVGGTGFAQDGDTICTIGSTTWKVNTSGYCWANLFKAYIESKFDNVTVLNYGCRSFTSSNLVSQINLGNIIDWDNDDLIICMIGTNDKWNGSIDTLKSNLNALILNCKSHGKGLVLLSAMPSSVASDTTHDGVAVAFHNEDIDHAYELCSFANNMGYISLYQKVLEYLDYTGISIDSILSDGLHPNDDGYYILYKIIMRELSIAYQMPNASWDDATPQS